MAVSKSTNGTDCWHTTRTMTARVSLWIGSYSPRAASADAIPEMCHREKDTWVDAEDEEGDVDEEIMKTNSDRDLSRVPVYLTHH